MGLLEERERAARQRVEDLQAQVREAEAVWERLVIARETVGQVLGVLRDDGKAKVTAAEARPAPAGGVVPGSVVPAWRNGLDASVLAPDYRRIMNALGGRGGSGGEALDCRQLAAVLGLEVIPAKVEGVRSKAKRLASRGWLAEDKPGMFSVAAGRVGGS